MIKLAICNVNNLDLSKSYPLLSQQRRQKVDSYHFNKDKRLSSGAELLLRKLLNEVEIPDPIFAKTKYDKLYLENYDDIYFNISHSKEYVACIISDKEVGVDIEYVDEAIDLDLAKHYFFRSEYENIIKSENPQDSFFKYWVLKESYMKYTGLGFQLELDSFEIIIDDNITLKDDDENLRFSLFNLEEYKLAVSSKYDVTSYTEYKLDELY